MPGRTSRTVVHIIRAATYDGQGVETDLWESDLAPPRKQGGRNTHRTPKGTAPPPDPTVIHATATPPCGRCPRSTSRRSSSTPSRSRPCGGRSKPWSGRSRSSAGKRHTWPGTTGRSPRRCAGAGADAPAGARAGSWSEPLVVPGSGVGRRSRSGLRFSTLAGQVGGPSRP